MRHELPGTVVFDLDGTLIDSAPDLHACANQMLAELDLPPLDLPQLTGFIGEGIPPLIERCLAAAGRPASGAGLEAAIRRYKQIYGAAPARHSRAYDGVGDCLADLQRRGVRLGVCTNKSEPLARVVLEALELRQYFAVVIGGDTLATRKPDPAPLLHAVRLLAGRSSDTIYVGDSEIDAATSAAAGIAFVLYTRGYRKAPVHALAHMAHFEDFGRLVDALRRPARP